MAIVHLGAKRLQGTKLDRVVDSLGSSADGTNTGITLTNDKLGYKILRKNSNESISYDIGTNLNANTWTCRLKLKNTSLANTESGANLGFWGISDKDSTVASDGSQDWIGFLSRCSNTEAEYFGHSVNDSTLGEAGTQMGANDIITSNLTTEWGWEIKRTGETTAVVTLYPNWNFTGTPTATVNLTVSSSYSALRYFVIRNFKNSTAKTTNLNGYVEEIKIWNGTNDTTTTPLYTSSFPTKTGWTAQNENNIGISKDTKLGTGAYSFNGSTDKITTTVQIPQTTDHTVTWWQKVNSTLATDTTYQFVMRATGSGGNYYAILFRDNYLKCMKGDGTQTQLSAQSNFAVGDWHHCALVRNDTTDDVTFYLDGSATTVTDGMTEVDTSANLWIGSNNGSEGTPVTLDDMSIWARSLTATEISDLVNLQPSSTADTTTPASWLTSPNTDDNTTSKNANNRVGNKIEAGNDLVGKRLGEVSFRIYVQSSYSGSNTASFKLWNSSGTERHNFGTFNISTLGTSAAKVTQNTSMGSGVTVAANDFIGIENNNTDSDIRVKQNYNETSGASESASIPYAKQSSWNGSSFASDSLADVHMEAKYYGTSPAGALVSSLSNKAGLKAHYTMDSTSKPLPTATLSEDFSSSSAWTLHSSSSISGGSLTCTNSGESYRSTGLGKPTNLTWDFTWTRNSGDDADTSALLLSSQTSGYGDPSTGHTNVQFYMANGNVTTLSVRKNSSGTNVQTECHFGVGSSSVNIQPTGTTRYYRITKDGSVWTMKKFTSASDRTNDTNAEASTTATQSSTADSTWNSGSGNLTYLVVDGHGSQTKDYTIDDVVVYEGVTTGCKNDFSSTSDLLAMTNLPTNTIFEQTDDTPSYWWKQSDNTWSLDGSVGTDISSGGWSTSGSQNAISEASGVITFNVPSSNTGDTLFIKSLPATAGSSWVVRYKLDITQSNYSGGGSGNHIVGISDSFSRSGSGEDPPSSSKSMYLKNTYHSDKKFAQYWTNGSTSGNDWSNGVTLSGGAQTWYVTIANNGGSITTRYGANSDYTGGSITSAWTVDSTTQSASKTKIFISTYASSSMSGGAFIGTISDLTFYNNRSSVPS